jgi:hypothetical protein
MSTDTFQLKRGIMKVGDSVKRGSETVKVLGVFAGGRVLVEDKRGKQGVVPAALLSR